MSCSELRRWVWCVGLLLCAACSRGPGAEQDPRPSRLVPAEGLSTALVPVVIEGENFLALATQRLADGPSVEVDARFEARLGDTPLTDVVLADDRHLRAVVPPGLKTGWYALTVVSPLGRGAVVPDAYFASEHAPARLEARARLERSPVAVGQQLQLVLDVSNLGESPALGVRPALGVTGGGQVTVVAAPASVDVGPGQQVSFTWTLRADGSGDVRLSPSASGTDGLKARPVVASVDPVPLAMRTPAALEARVLFTGSALNVGQEVDVGLEVHNTGELEALAVTPACAPSGSVSVLSAPQATDIPGGERRTFSWRYRVEDVGAVAFSLSASGTEALGGAPLTAGPLATDALPVLRPAALSAELSAPSTVSVGQVFAVSLRATNPGEATARTVTPQWDVPPALEVQVPPAPVDIAGGQSALFMWSVRAKTPGAVTLAPSLQGTDANSGAPVSAGVPPGGLTVQTEARLSGSVSLTPAQVSVGQRVTLELRVRNDGQASARDVIAAVPVPSGTAGLTPRSSPPPVSLLPGGAEAVFTWTYDAAAPGQALLTAGASGYDANSGTTLAMPPVTSAPVTVVREVQQLAADPFGDGTAFSFVFRYNGRVYLGPNKTGTGGVRMLPDGTGAESFTWRLPADTVGNRTSNAKPPPYTSLGATGCVKDTYACGPDDENGRGLFFAGTAGGQEWLGAMGSNTAGDLDYVYLTQDTGTQLDFRFVDLDGVPLGGQTKGASSALFFKDRLYLGLPDTGGSRPYLAVVKRLPSTAPGFDAVAPTDAEVLAADRMPGLGKSGSPSNAAAMQMIDAMAAFNDALYVTNNGGCMRSTTPTPRRYDTNPGDWAVCTPSLPAWTSRVSRTTPKTADLEPEDKAVPQLAVFGGRLYLARNTTGGPQLFMCTPGRSGDPAQCDAGDWALVAPNTRGDTLLTQFDDANNTSLALLAATANHLYLGYNNAAEGLVLLRSEGTAPATLADFRGAGGCAASQLTSGCAGLGGNGLGAGATRLFSGEALTFGGEDFVYVIAGDGSNPVRVFRVAD